MLAASDIAHWLLFGGNRGLASVLIAVGFAGIACAALYKPTGFLAVSWQQLRSPSKLGVANGAGVSGAALLVISSILQWFKI